MKAETSALYDVRHRMMSIRRPYELEYFDIGDVLDQVSSTGFQDREAQAEQRMVGQRKEGKRSVVSFQEDEKSSRNFYGGASARLASTRWFVTWVHCSGS